jgi:hypothetical protein
MERAQPVRTGVRCRCTHQLAVESLPMPHRARSFALSTNSSPPGMVAFDWQITGATLSVKMKHLSRIGVAIDSTCSVDALIEKRGYQNRSEAFRDLIREAGGRELGLPGSRVVLSTLVYDHRAAARRQ